VTTTRPPVRVTINGVSIPIPTDSLVGNYCKKPDKWYEFIWHECYREAPPDIWPGSIMVLDWLRSVARENKCTLGQAVIVALERYEARTSPIWAEIEALRKSA
jgi:hypothetical protein